ncbi:unnamed protein product [Ranitomeya imitator]|uniref:VPS13-like middle region domain-containing protein n=1 Tax=Ranitomeya imitator TaxID=111125 RepID=A0ABN9L454_9NEOB|nr:unnamed protein product [Ranitomeya imitator]
MRRPDIPTHVVKIVHNESAGEIRTKNTGNPRKIRREVLHTSSAQSDEQILQPINLSLSVNRNLAATWYHEIPILEVNGHLNSMELWLSQEDLNVIFSVLVENLGEGKEENADSKQTSGQTEIVKSKSVLHTVSTNKDLAKISETETIQSTSELSLLINFEIKKVVVQLMKQVRGNAPPLHVIQASQLGAVTRVGNHEMTAAVYLQKISMTCTEFPGPTGGPLLLVNSSDDTNKHLLKMEYVKSRPPSSVPSDALRNYPEDLAASRDR